MPRIWTKATGWGTVSCSGHNLDGPLVFIVWDDPRQRGGWTSTDILDTPGLVVDGAAELIRLVQGAPGVGFDPLYAGRP